MNFIHDINKTIIQRIAWRERMVWAYMSEHKQREIAYFEIVLLVAQSAQSLDARLSSLRFGRRVRIMVL